MSMCPNCEAASPDGLLCGECTRRLRKDLQAIPELARELDTTLARLGQAGSGNGGKSAETPLPFDLAASEVGWNVRNNLSTWVRELELGDPLPADTIRGMAHWLLARIERIRGHAASAEVADTIADSVKMMKRVIDRGGKPLFGGPCDVCGGDLYGWGDRATCRKCDVVVGDLTVRRARMMAESQTQVVDKQTILHAVPELYGVQVSDTRFRKWVSRGVLKRRIMGVERNRFVVGYLVADVATLAAAHATRTKAG